MLLELYNWMFPPTVKEAAKRWLVNRPKIGPVVTTVSRTGHHYLWDGARWEPLKFYAVPGGLWLKDEHDVIIGLNTTWGPNGELVVEVEGGTLVYAPLPRTLPPGTHTAPRPCE